MSEYKGSAPVEGGVGEFTWNLGMRLCRKDMKCNFEHLRFIRSARSLPVKLNKR